MAAVLAAGVAGLPADAAAAQPLFLDSPRVGQLRALVPQEGRDAGHLIVWARVSHASPSVRAVARERPQTIHTGRVTVRVGRVKRFASKRLEFVAKRLVGGYHLRFSRVATRALLSGASRRIRVSVRMSQTVDVDSDGDTEDRQTTAALRTVPVATPATAIVPTDGWYIGDSQNRFLVEAGSVVHYDLPGGGATCANTANAVSAPVDPQTGTFSFDDDDFADTKVNGQFFVSNPGYNAEINATVTIGGCTYNAPNGYAYCPPSWQSCAFSSRARARR